MAALNLYIGIHINNQLVNNMSDYAESDKRAKKFILELEGYANSLKKQKPTVEVVIEKLKQKHSEAEEPSSTSWLKEPSYKDGYILVQNHDGIWEREDNPGYSHSFVFISKDEEE